MRGSVLVIVIVILALMSLGGAPATTPSLTPGRVRLILPPVIYAVPDVEANIYFDNTVLVLDRDDYAFDAICDKGIQLAERWALKPTAKDVGEYPIEVALRDKDNQVLAQAKSVVKVISAEQMVKTTLLIVGDSLTQRAIYPQQLRDLDQADESFDLTLIGCRGADNAPAKGPLRHEGYSGWTAEAFATFSGPLSRTGEFKRPDTGSPFVYPDESGKPRLDFARYCKQFNDGVGPDAITIFLGTNDVFSATDATIEATIDRMFKHYDALVRAFAEVRRDTRIGVVLTTPPARSQDGFRGYTGAGRQTRWQYRRNLHRLLERLIEHYGNREAEHIYLVPAYVNLDAERHFPSREAPTNARSREKIVRIIDGAHPSTEGYAQIADSIYCWLKATTSQPR